MSEVGSLKTEVCHTGVTSALTGYEILGSQRMYRYFGLIIKFLNFFILQMDIRRARQAVEKKDEQLDASRRILEAQEDELFVSCHIRAPLKCTGNQQFCGGNCEIWSSFGND